MTLEFYFDLASPYAYLALARLPVLVLPQGCTIAYRPVDVEELKRAAGNIGPALRDLSSKKSYVLRDAARWAKRCGIAFTEPAGWDATRLNRGTFMAIDRGMAARYLDVAARHVWGAGGDPAGEALIAAVATEMGWAPQELLSYTLSAPAAQRQRETLAAARAAGVFGVPTSVLNGQLWWGNDRLEFVQEALNHG
jgi:2-hydroxychromene-2-carboxylate isomerase